MKTIDQEIEELLTELQSLIAQAAKKADFGLTAKLSQNAKELEVMKGQIKDIKARLGILKKNLSGNPMPEASTGKFRKLFCEVTGGCVRQNLLTLTRQIQRGVIKVGETMEIELPDGKRFITDVVEKGNKLRERGEIARFYRENHIIEGSYVVLEEISLGKWLLRRTRPDEPPPRESGNKYVNF